MLEIIPITTSLPHTAPSLLPTITPYLLQHLSHLPHDLTLLGEEGGVLHLHSLHLSLLSPPLAPLLAHQAGLAMAITLPATPTTLATLHRVVLGEAVTREEEEEVIKVLHLLGINTNMVKITEREKNKTEDEKGQPMKVEPKVESFNNFNLGSFDIKPDPLDEVSKGKGATQNGIRIDSETEAIGKCNESISLKCELCEKTYSTKGTLKTHTRTQHNPDSPVEMRKKNPRIDGDSRFQCEHCIAAFESLIRLQRHCRKAHAGSLASETIEKLSKLDLEEKRRARKRRARYKKIKMEKELAEGPVQCELCSSIFETGQKLRKHQRAFHIERPFQCSMCMFKFVGQNELDSHFFKSHVDTSNEECTICGGVYKNKNSLYAHVQGKHKEIYTEICNFCGDVFKNIRKHLKRSTCRPENKPEANFKCNICSKTFTMPHTLRKHIKVIHEKVKDHACESCDYKTSSKYNLDLHQGSIHNGVRPKKQQCPHCDKTPYKLDWHISTYHSLT